LDLTYCSMGHSARVFTLSQMVQMQDVHKNKPTCLLRNLAALARAAPCMCALRTAVAAHALAAALTAGPRCARGAHAAAAALCHYQAALAEALPALCALFDAACSISALAQGGITARAGAPRAKVGPAGLTGGHKKVLAALPRTKGVPALAARLCPLAFQGLLGCAGPARDAIAGPAHHVRQGLAVSAQTDPALVTGTHRPAAGSAEHI
jgi:hypothetical protein